MQDIIMPIMIDDIVVAEDRRDVDSTVVNRLADSIKNIGLKHPVTVRRKGDKYSLVAGLHRLEAHKKLGLEHITSCIVSMTNAEARMWEIAENLHRAELSKLERSEQVAEWIKLCEQVSRQVDAKPGRPEGGVRAAARDLGITEPEARRSIQIASITDEAKEAAAHAGIDDNQSKLLAVAREAPERQTAKVVELAAHPLNDFETKEKWLSSGISWWNRGSKEWREEFLSRVECPVMDRQYGTDR